MKQKHIDFCEIYLANGYNAAQAYKAAYPHTDQTQSAYRLLKRDDVVAYLEQRRKELYEERLITAETVATELAKMAFSPNTDEIFTYSHKLKALELIQKQFGFQTQKIEAEVKQQVLFEGELDLED